VAPCRFLEVGLQPLLGRRAKPTAPSLAMSLHAWPDTRICIWNEHIAAPMPYERRPQRRAKPSAPSWAMSRQVGQLSLCKARSK